MYERQSYQGLHMCNRRMFKTMAKMYTAKLQTLNWATWMLLCLTAPALLSKAVSWNRMHMVQDSRVNEQGHSQTTHIMMQKLFNLGDSKILYTWAQNVPVFFFLRRYIYFEATYHPFQSLTNLRYNPNTVSPQGPSGVLFWATINFSQSVCIYTLPLYKEVFCSQVSSLNHVFEVSSTMHSIWLVFEDFCLI